jgi:hypothetical protein
VVPRRRERPAARVLGFLAFRWAGAGEESEGDFEEKKFHVFLDLIFRFAPSIEINIKSYILKSCMWNRKM